MPLAVGNAIFEHFHDADFFLDLLGHQGDAIARADRGHFFASNLALHRRGGSRSEWIAQLIDQIAAIEFDEANARILQARQVDIDGLGMIDREAETERGESFHRLAHLF